MNLPQFQIILQKINALDKNIMMDGKISSIEKDLMKAYVSQLYEACVNDDASKVASEPKVEAVAQTPIPVVTTTPTAQVPVQNTPPPAVDQPVVTQPVVPTPIQQPIAVTNNNVTPPPAPVQQPVQQVTQPVQQVAEPVAPIVPAPAVSPEPQAENKLKDINDRIAANTKTVADKLSNPQGKSLNDRLADKSVGKTFNDRFTKDDNITSNTNVSAPKMVVIPDSIKHLDNSSTTAPITQPAATVTPTPTPVEPAPVAKVTPTPTPASQPVHSGSVNINEIYALFDDDQASEAAGKWGSTPIQDLSKSIGLNDKISMIKELFNDDHQAFNNSLTQLNSLGNFNEAKDYMMRNLVTVFKWNEGGKLDRAKQLINLVRRRYK